MNKEKIEESNLLIAEFMGLKNQDAYYKYAEDHVWLFNDEQYEWNVAFNESWDWLMPVVDKIESIVGFQINIERCSIDGTFYNYYFIDDGSYKSANIKQEGYYQAVVNFIKWYNKQNKI